MRKKTWLILAGAIICAVVVWLVVTRLYSSVEVEAATAEMGAIREFIDERAKTRLRQTYLITMPYTARIKPITLTEGTPVKQGDPVAEVVPVDIELAVAEATAGQGEADAAIAENADLGVEQSLLEQTANVVESMKGMTAAAAAQEEASKASFEYAVSDLNRIRELRKSRARTADELEQATLRQERSAAAYRQSGGMHSAMKWLQLATDLMPEMIRRYIARKKLGAAVLQRRKAGIDARLRKALLDRDRGTMTSPVDGVVLSRALSNEQLVPAGTTLLQIGRLEDLEIEADVLSLHAVKAEQGHKVEIYGPAVGERRADGKDHAEGIVEKIYPAGFTKISSLGVEQQRVRVIIRISDEDLAWLRRERKLGVGYRVRVRIFTAEKSSALVIPRSALFRGTGGQWQVYAVRNGRTQIQDVQVGLVNDQSVEITAGVSQGEQVVLAPESNLEDRARVRVKPKEKKKD